MLTRRMDTWEPMAQLRDEMNRLFGEYFPGRGSGPGTVPAFPAMNIWEDQQNMYIEAELPGLKMDDLELTVMGNELTVKGERKAPHYEKAAFHRRERGVGSFNRVIRLPVDIDADKVEAGLQDGVLQITLPKAEAAKPRKIEVKGANK